MTELSQDKCVPCRKGGTSASEEEVRLLMRDLSGWEIVEIDGIRRLTRTFLFNNFKQALAFTNRVAEIAEIEQHHPALLTEWGKVTVSWWTHKIGGLHRNDFIMAAKTGQLQEE